MIICIKRQSFIITSIVLILAIIASVLYITAIDNSGEDENLVYVPIIMYHEIKTYKLGKDVISPYEFESDLQYLKSNNYNTITMADLINYVYNNGTLPENPIVISFDDGYLSTYKYALPLLKKYEMKIVFSILGKNTDDFTQIPDNNIDYSHVTWAQLNEMLDSGYVEVQNHTYNLHYCGSRLGCMKKAEESLADYEKTLTEDITKLQDEIKLYTGKVPDTFTYPYGKSSESTVDIVKKLGFKATLSCNYGINKISKAPECLFNLKRIARAHGTTMEKVLIKGFKTVKR
ncbi:MAG: polysaccharide deacetylase family protein [Bacillota bacterium]|nr:polysaccharide deacetylase family protein [Bacillota bacterium]